MRSSSSSLWSASSSTIRPPVIACSNLTGALAFGRVQATIQVGVAVEEQLVDQLAAQLTVQQPADVAGGLPAQARDALGGMQEFRPAGRRRWAVGGEDAG